MVEVELTRIIINERSEQQVIVLKEKKGPRAFPIVIGIFEAYAIDRGIKEVRTPRPLTHDLIVGLVRSLNAQLTRVVVSDLRKGTFYAKLVMVHGGKNIEVDSRPSDAIALAVLLGAPIFVEEQILDAVSQASAEAEGAAEEGEKEEGEEEDDAPPEGNAEEGQGEEKGA